jgi:hypothetical protein
VKTILKISILPALLLLMASSAYAASIEIGSYGTNSNGTGYSPSGITNTALNYEGYVPTYSGTGIPITGNTRTSYDVDRDTSPSGPSYPWADPITGTSWVSNVSDGSSNTSQSDGYYEYDTTFSATAGTYSGKITIASDDTAQVILDGVTVIPFSDDVSDGADKTFTFNISLLSGTNTLYIIDQQELNNSPLGVDFAGAFTPVTTPEPSSLLLLGTGLLGLAFVAFRRAKASGPAFLSM